MKKDTPADNTGADLIDSVPMVELMPPIKDPRALTPVGLPAPGNGKIEETFSVAGIDEVPAPPKRTLVVGGADQEGPFIIIIQHKTKRTLHPLLDQRRGPGAMAVFNTREAATTAQATYPACKNNWSTILSVL